MTFLEKINELRKELNSINFDDVKMTLPEKRIAGVSFFPCGDGSYKNSTKNKKILVLGQDQDNEKGYNKSILKETESYSPTWKNIEELFTKAGIDLDTCFFTNALMGIRISELNTGKSPGLFNDIFLKQNVSFLKKQISIIKPISIITLGIIPLKILSMINEDLMWKYSFLDTFKEIDESNSAIILDVNIENIQTNVGIIVHPSYRKVNCKDRKFNNFQGEEAEIEILKTLNSFC